MGLATPIIQVMRPAILFLLAATACAQTFSSHGGWSFTDTFQTATDVLVGDIVSGSAVDDGSQVSVKATLRVVRVLGGNAAAGSDLAIQWQYRPMPLESPAVTSTVPKVRGLWFLRRAEGKLQPLQATVMMSSLGGFYLPAGDAPRYYSGVAPALNRGSMPMTSMGIDVRANLPAAHALGRLSIGETPLSGIEGGASSQLASTHSPEFLPYLIVMLGSPSPSTRDLALMSFCQLLRDQQFWTAEMLGYCPNRSPLT